MKLTMYSVYDQKSKLHLPPFTTINHPIAVRNFADAVNNKHGGETIHPFAMHPSDYLLKPIGIFDDETGEVTPPDQENCPMSINGLELVVSTTTNTGKSNENTPFRNDSPIQSGT